MRHLYRLVPAFLALMASACTGVVVQDDPGPRGRYFVGDFDYAAGNSAIETVIVGNPFGGPKPPFDERVRNLMKHQNRGVPAEFVDGQTDRTDPLYKVVVAFNLPPGFPNYDMCKNPTGLPSRHHTGRLEIAIAFCEGDEVKSDTTGYATDVHSVNDPRFAELVRYATLYMVTDHEDREGTGDEGNSVNP